MAASRVCLVTGANKGIGLAIVENLCKNPQAKNLHILLGSRSKENGEKAMEKLHSESKCGDRVSPIVIDIDDENSIQKAAEEIKSNYGGLDILINNAGMAFKGDAFDENVARTTSKTNYYGTKNACKILFPLLRPGARVVNVSSSMSVKTLSDISQNLRDQFMKDDLTIDKLDSLMEKFCKDVANGTYQQEGWNKSAYGVSKVGVSMLTRILARDNKIEGALINCCCPGWVKTDMAGDKAPLTPAQGAETPVHLALLPEGSPNGKHWKDKEVQPYHA